MTAINLAAFGFNGPSTFAAAGPAQNIKIQDDTTNITIAGGVILGSPTHEAVADPVLYGTADSQSGGVGLTSSITISFAQPIADFQVYIFNGLTTPATYQVTDGNPADTVTITLPANSSPMSAQPVQIAETHGATVFNITPVVGGNWDFFIDNISYNFSPGEELAASAPLQDKVSELLDSAETLASTSAQAAENFASGLFADLGICASEAYQLVTDAAADPSDPNYKQPYTPTFFQFSPIQSDSTITPHTAADANTALTDFSKAIGYMQALVTTMNRLSSATSAGDQASITLQTAEFDTYITLASSSLAAVGKDMNTLANDLTGVSLPTVTAAEIASFENGVTANGVSALTQQEQSLLQSLGVSSTDLQGIISAIGSVDPSTVPLSLVTALQQVSTSLLSIASAYAGASVTAQSIQNEYLGLTRTALDTADATTEANAIVGGSTTENAYVNSLLHQVADTTIPVVAVEASMYGAVGSSAVITNLVTNFLPGQLAYANQVGLDLQTFACLETALVFAFANESGSTAFANNFGPSNASMPATAAGDAAFAAAATNAIFGSAQTANTAPAILGYVHFLEGFFTANGIVGVQNPTPDQIVIAARAGAWGEGIAIAEGNNLGPFPGPTTNFLEDAAQGTAIYSASLSSQPTAAPFQGATTASVASTASHVQVIGVAAPVDHAVM